MELHSTLDDKEFKNQFETCALPPILFTHEAHLRIAWIYIRQYGVDAGALNLCAQLCRFVSHIGAVDKYNETLTVAATRAVYHFMLKSESDSFEKFIIENPRLKHSLRDLLRQHYTTDIFTSDRAKRQYLEPELLPFD
jgi:hypothetical protein